jgi:hypothetical protein
MRGSSLCAGFVLVCSLALVSVARGDVIKNGPEHLLEGEVANKGDVMAGTSEVHRPRYAPAAI